VADAARHVRAVLVAGLVWIALLAPSAVRAQPAAPEPDVPDARRAVLQRVLGRPEFQRTAGAVLLDEARKRLSAWFLRMWDRFGLGRLGTERAATGLAWALALLALGALTWWLLQSLARSGSRQRLGIPSPASRERSARAWARAAVDAAAAGDEREAARCAYRAAVVRLEEEGAWRQDDTRTPREYLRILPAAHRRHSLAADMTARFERVWYGAVRSSDDTRALLARLEELGCHASDRAT
jgi:hypothetical protein